MIGSDPACESGRFVFDRRLRPPYRAQQAVAWRLRCVGVLRIREKGRFHDNPPRAAADAARAESGEGRPPTSASASGNLNIVAEADSANCCASIDFHTDIADLDAPSEPEVGVIVSKAFCSSMAPRER
ncbi:MAG: hypothetical protein QM651_02295 [Rhodoblastus sp.]